MQGLTGVDAYANALRRDALLGLARFSSEAGDMHIALLNNLAQGCLKLNQNEAALIYANAAMRLRDRHGKVSVKSGYRAALAADKMGLWLASPFLIAQARSMRDSCWTCCSACRRCLLQCKCPALAPWLQLLCSSQCCIRVIATYLESISFELLCFWRVVARQACRSIARAQPLPTRRLCLSC